MYWVLLGLSFAYKLHIRVWDDRWAGCSGWTFSASGRGESCSCCQRPCALQAPLSLSSEGLFLHLSLTTPETFLFHLCLSYGCSFSFLFIFECSPFTRIGNNFLLARAKMQSKEIPNEEAAAECNDSCNECNGSWSFLVWHGWVPVLAVLGGYTSWVVWWENSFQTTYSYSQTDFRKSTNGFHRSSLWVYVV